MLKIYFEVRSVDGSVILLDEPTSSSAMKALDLSAQWKGRDIYDEFVLIRSAHVVSVKESTPQGRRSRLRRDRDQHRVEGEVELEARGPMPRDDSDANVVPQSLCLPCL